MALTQESLTRAARRKAQLAKVKVHSAEEQLESANTTLREAIPRKDVKAITKAAEQTAVAEIEVREAAQELEAVTELLDDGKVPPPNGNASGEGVRSLMPFLGKR
jgi:hypothetical protein